MVNFFWYDGSVNCSAAAVVKAKLTVVTAVAVVGNSSAVVTTFLRTYKLVLRIRIPDPGIPNLYYCLTTIFWVKKV